MPYVQRDANAKVCGIYAVDQPGIAEEWLDENAADLLAFRNPPPPAPKEISDRQFFQQLAIAGLISQAEALAAVKTGEIPAAMSALIDAMSEEDRFAARMLVSGATVFQRSHPMTAALGAAFGMEPAAIDALWTAAAAL